MTDKQITREDLVARVADWKSRINSLYETIEKWLSNMDGYTIKKQDTVYMHEELMQKYSIPPENLNVLDILHNDEYIATIKPIGLWIIGANGRLDIISKKGSIILIDEADNFKKPKWTAYLPNNKKDGAPFTINFLSNILEIYS